jgi:hypothetical protein
MMRRAIISLLMLCLALLAPRGVLADRQHQGSSTLTGVVLGPDDKPVVHASVTYQSSSGKAPHAIYTNSKGRFTITKLQADNYDLRASSKGLFSEWEKNVTLSRGQTREITLQLIYSRELPANPKPSKPKQ